MATLFRLWMPLILLGTFTLSGCVTTRSQESLGATSLSAAKQVSANTLNDQIYAMVKHAGGILPDKQCGTKPCFCNQLQIGTVEQSSRSISIVASNMALHGGVFDSNDWRDWDSWLSGHSIEALNNLNRFGGDALKELQRCK